MLFAVTPGAANGQFRWRGRLYHATYKGHIDQVRNPPLPWPVEWATALTARPRARPNGKSAWRSGTRLPARSYRTGHRDAGGVGRTTAPNPPPRYSDAREACALWVANLRPSWRGQRPGWWRCRVVALTRRCGPAYHRAALSTYSCRQRPSGPGGAGPARVGASRISPGHLITRVILVRLGVKIRHAAPASGQGHSDHGVRVPPHARALPDSARGWMAARDAVFVAPRTAVGSQHMNSIMMRFGAGNAATSLSRKLYLQAHLLVPAEAPRAPRQERRGRGRPGRAASGLGFEACW